MKGSISDETSPSDDSLSPRNTLGFGWGDLTGRGQVLTDGTGLRIVVVAFVRNRSETRELLRYAMDTRIGTATLDIRSVDNRDEGTAQQVKGKDAKVDLLTHNGSRL
jgi:hypothetical protein